MLSTLISTSSSTTTNWPPYSHAQCIGELHTTGVRATQLVRNTGGGTAPCCWMHPVAAPARVSGGSVQCSLQPLQRGHTSRNGARVYLADTCTEGNYDETTYASLMLLGRTLSLTVDLSAANCGCNAAWCI